MSLQHSGDCLLDTVTRQLFTLNLRNTKYLHRITRLSSARLIQRHFRSFRTLSRIQQQSSARKIQWKFRSSKRNLPNMSHLTPFDGQRVLDLTDVKFYKVFKDFTTKVSGINEYNGDPNFLMKFIFLISRFTINCVIIKLFNTPGACTIKQLIDSVNMTCWIIPAQGIDPKNDETNYSQQQANMSTRFIEHKTNEDAQTRL